MTTGPKPAKPRSYRRRLRGNFFVSVNEELIGGWPHTNPTEIRAMVREFVPNCQNADPPMAMSVEIAETIMETFFDDPSERVTNRQLDELDAELIVWWLAQTDPGWPQMMREFGRGTDFTIDLSNASGTPEAVVYSSPTPSLH